MINGETEEEKKVDTQTGEKRIRNTYESFPIESRKSESKVVYQYPKQGNFRFPVIDDEPKKRREKNKRVPETTEKRQPNRPVTATKQEKEPERKWNPNSEFKLTAIPSPIYGFKERETAKSKLGDSVSVLPFEKKKQQDEPVHAVNTLEELTKEHVEEASFMNETLSTETQEAVMKNKPTVEIKEHIEEIQAAVVEKKSYGVPSVLEEALARATTEESVFGDILEKAEVEEATEQLGMKLEQLESTTEHQEVETEEDNPVLYEEEPPKQVVTDVKEEKIEEDNLVLYVEEELPEQAVTDLKEVEIEEDNPVLYEEEELPEQAVTDLKKVEMEEVTPVLYEEEEPPKQVVTDLKEVEIEEDTPVLYEEEELPEQAVPDLKAIDNDFTKDEERESDTTPSQEVHAETVEAAAPAPMKEILPKEEMNQKVIKSEETRSQEQDEKYIESSKQAEASKREGNSESSQKKSIPFNVMMLPQDKAKKKQAPVEVLPKPESPLYSYPSIQLLNYPELQEQDESQWLEEQGDILEETLQSFHVDAKVVHVTKGPSVTRFEVQPGRGVKVTKITGLTDDMKLALAAKDIRIEAPIPGKNTIGIEVPNRNSTPVFLREILRRKDFIRSESPLTVALGLDISGQPIVTDLKKMPHGLVAGATGSGKSVCINSVLISLLFKATPDEVKLLLIDPKMVELAPYNGLPHLVTPVITDAKQATAALKWVVLEMERRYELFSQQGVRDVGRYNEIYSESPEKPALPFILVVIDELADLMMVSPQEVEDSICRIAQKARACGIHLLLATQRPSVDVITGLIKANIPTRIAFSVSSQTDSRTILDMGGAERLLGKGDMLFHENGSPKPVRVQGTFVSDQEIEDVVAHVKKQREPEYLLQIDQLKHVAHGEADDEHFEEACYFVIDQGSASASSLQRRFRVGYNRAARLIDMMEERGIVSEAMGSKPRHVLVDEIGLEELLYHKEG
nr:DNA translocase FtsK [Alkalihalobacillus sp. MEB130]